MAQALGRPVTPQYRFDQADVVLFLSSSAGDGVPDVYLNSASYARGGYAAVRADGRPLWVEFHVNLQGSDGFGPVGGWVAVLIYVMVLGSTLFLRWRSRAWQRIYL